MSGESAEVITADAKGVPVVDCSVCGTRQRVLIVPLPGLRHLCVSFHKVNGERCPGTKRHDTEKLRDFMPARAKKQA